jgi:hypothetical protein
MVTNPIVQNLEKKSRCRRDGSHNWDGDENNEEANSTLSRSHAASQTDLGSCEKEEVALLFRGLFRISWKRRESLANTLDCTQLL